MLNPKIFVSSQTEFTFINKHKKIIKINLETHHPVIIGIRPKHKVKKKVIITLNIYYTM